jgi:hypothetical protein
VGPDRARAGALRADEASSCRDADGLCGSARADDVRTREGSPRALGDAAQSARRQGSRRGRQHRRPAGRGERGRRRARARFGSRASRHAAHARSRSGAPYASTYSRSRPTEPPSASHVAPDEQRVITRRPRKSTVHCACPGAPIPSRVRRDTRNTGLRGCSLLARATALSATCTRGCDRPRLAR